MMKNSIVLLNGIVVTENQCLKNHSVVIKNGIIKSIIPNEEATKLTDCVKVDCSGKYILPGLIDIHSDSIEKIIVPRKGVKFDLELSLYEMDQQCMHQGITTIYHSLTMAATTICDNTRTIKPLDIFALSDLLLDKNDLYVRHRVHIRLELNTTDVYDDLVNYMNNGKVHELSFMDHTPGQGQYRDITMFEKVIKQQYGEITESERIKIINTCMKKKKISYDKIVFLISIANKQGIPIAYHDVETNEQVDWMVSHKFKICEFPLSSTVSEYALKKGLYCVVGSPNVILGKSHYNNASAIELLSQKQANILCSDYFSPTLLTSVFKLNRECNIPLHIAVGYATLNPARAVGISKNYGSISEGKVADIIVVDTEFPTPRVIMTIIDGIIKNTTTTN